jgi:hypothetical protein
MTKRDNPYQGNPLLGQRPNRRLTSEEVRERYIAVFQHYGISDPENDPKAIYKLVNLLLVTHVPGFQPKPSGGRPKKRTPSDVAAFVIELIQNQRKFGNAPLQTTLKEMSKDPWWAKNGFGDTKKDVLQAMRYEARELGKPEKRIPIERALDMMALVHFEELSKSPEEQSKLRDRLGEDSPEWRDVEVILGVLNSARARRAE